MQWWLILHQFSPVICAAGRQWERANQDRVSPAPAWWGRETAVSRAPAAVHCGPDSGRAAGWAEPRAEMGSDPTTPCSAARTYSSEPSHGTIERWTQIYIFGSQHVIGWIGSPSAPTWRARLITATSRGSTTRILPQHPHLKQKRARSKFSSSNINLVFKNQRALSCSTFLLVYCSINTNSDNAI